LPSKHGKLLLQSPLLETKLKPLGNGSVTTTSLACEGPLFLTVIVNVALSPGTNSSGAVLTISKSVLETTAVGSLAVLLLVTVSPPPFTLAVLVRFAAADCSTLTVTAMAGALELAAMAVSVLHCTVCPAILHVQPAPTALTGVKPTGRLSLRFTVELVGAVPMLLAVML
jgi:hypothetical protein